MVAGAYFTLLWTCSGVFERVIPVFHLSFRPFLLYFRSYLFVFVFPSISIPMPFPAILFPLPFPVEKYGNGNRKGVFPPVSVRFHL